jgi:hypothetical protein
MPDYQHFSYSQIAITQATPSKFVISLIFNYSQGFVVTFALKTAPFATENPGLSKIELPV